MADKPVAGTSEQRAAETAPEPAPKGGWLGRIAARLGDLLTRLVTLTDEIRRLHATNAALGERVEELARVVNEHEGTLAAYRQIIEQQNRLIDQYGKRIDDFTQRLDEAVELRVMREAERQRDNERKARRQPPPRS